MSYISPLTAGDARELSGSAWKSAGSMPMRCQRQTRNDRPVHSRLAARGLMRMQQPVCSIRTRSATTYLVKIKGSPRMGTLASKAISLPTWQWATENLMPSLDYWATNSRSFFPARTELQTGSH
jgi:hypothetical protein